MGKKRTESCKYQSRYSPNTYVTAAQYIIELVCERKAVFDGTKLPIHFWKLEEWRTYFVRNLRKVHSFLKRYDELAIINAIKSEEFSNRWSIFTVYFTELVSKEQDKIDIQSQKKSVHTKVNRGTITSKPRPQRIKKNILTKLDDIE